MYLDSLKQLNKSMQVILSRSDPKDCIKHVHWMDDTAVKNRRIRWIQLSSYAVTRTAEKTGLHHPICCCHQEACSRSSTRRRDAVSSVTFVESL